MIERPRILLLNPMLDPAGHALLAEQAEVEVVASDADPGRLRAALAAADALVVRLPGRVTGETIAQAPRLRVIAAAGAGVDHIDVAAATAAGIPVVNNAGVGPGPVAEHAVGLMLALLRRIAVGDRRLRREHWACRERLLDDDLGSELSGKTVGVVGLGAIGRRVAAICSRGFGARVVAFDPWVDQDVFDAAGAERRSSLDSLLREADIVTLHVPLTERTRGLIGERELRVMRPGSYLINCARGAVVDHRALARALVAGWIAGAGIDVFDPEPPPPDLPLFSLDQVVVTPHITGLSRETNRRLAVSTARQVLQVLAGERPPHVVNPEVSDRRRGAGRLREQPPG